MRSLESRAPDGTRSEIRLYAEPADAVPHAPVTTEIAGQRADMDAALNLLWLQRQAQIDSIRAAALADIAKTGQIAERTINRMRNFKEEWQDFCWGDLIAYDDVFEDSDHG